MQTNRHWKLKLICGLLSLLAAGSVHSQQMNYQGRLTDSVGNPVADGQYTVKFDLFDDANSGAKVWGPQHIAADVVDGRFNVVLGPFDTASPQRALAFAFEGRRYLQITFQGSAIKPRQEVLFAPSAFYALQARQVGPLIGVDGTIGVGTLTPGATLDVVGSIRAQGPGIFREVGIGTPDDNLPGATLHVNGTNDTILPVRFQVGGGTKFLLAPSGGVSIGAFHQTPPENGLYVAGQVALGTFAPTHMLHVNGVARSSQSTWATSSDRRAKKNILPVEGSLERVMRLRPVTFEFSEAYRADRSGYEGVRTGFIAQEVEEVFPSMVSTVAEQIGDETLEDFKLLSTGDLLPHAVAAIRELRAEKDAEIAALEARLEKLESLLNDKLEIAGAE